MVRPHLGLADLLYPPAFLATASATEGMLSERGGALAPGGLAHGGRDGCYTVFQQYGAALHGGGDFGHRGSSATDGALLAGALLSLEPKNAALVILAADPFAKMVASQLILMMPYARKEEEAKAKTVYRKFGTTTGISLAIQGLLPMGTFIWLTGIAWETVIFLPCLVMYFLYLLMWRKIHGYTGDCCGAAFLLVELAVYLVVCVQYHLLTI